MTTRERWLHRVAFLIFFASMFPVALSAQVWGVGNRMLAVPGGQANAAFGEALAIGDFNGDGILDLAVGAGGWDSATIVDAGAFWVYWGSTSRTLSASGPHGFGNVGPFCTGAALAAGDFDGDDRDELAVGSPCAGVGSADFAGYLTIWDYASGTWTLRVGISEDDIPGASAAEYESFGERLAVGDFDNDGRDDLAVGVPLEQVGPHALAGRVFVLRGSASVWLRTDDAFGFSSPTEAAGEQFGFALAAGDFDHDGYADLAVGMPFRTVSGHADAGAVEVYSGSASGLVIGGPQVLDDGDFPASNVEGGEQFGHSLVAGDFNQSPFYCAFHPTSCWTDLAIGAPGQFLSGMAGVGKVMVAYGSAAGLLPATGSYLSQSLLGEGPSANNHFGRALAAGRLDRDLTSPADLAIGCPWRNIDEINSGDVGLVFGKVGGFGADPASQFVTPYEGWESYPRYDYDYFGSVLAIGDFDGDGWGDLAVGVPRKGSADSGIVQVVYGALFADGFELGQIFAWSDWSSN